MTQARRYPVGAEPGPQGTHFRVWAPRSENVAVVLSDELGMARARRCPLEPEDDGYFSGLVPGALPGQYYKYQLDGGEFPDPASRFQPEGPHGPSEIVDDRAYVWNDSSWAGVSRAGQVAYELHVGTFTASGTWAAALERLPKLAELGITLIEVMPVADFPGIFGWGYDGVDLFAPTRLYGRPNDFRQFVDRAHALGMGVILDVVYNHFGPDGCYLREFSRDYFSSKYENEWGDPLNFDGENSGPVREFFLANAAYWIAEFHLDGLRFDATQQIFDASKDYVVAAMARHARTAAGRRGIYLVAENEPQDSALVRSPEKHGYGLDALWNDDFHHSAKVALTGQCEAYYTDYRGTPQEFVSAAKWGYLYQGQRYRWQNNRRGSPSLDIDPCQFVSFLQNHDQVANSISGKRIHELASPAQLRALTALLLLGPATPMLFQGQEFGASAPFHYFADHHPELAGLVAEGRRKFVAQFPTAASVLGKELLHLPHARTTFESCRLDWSECDSERHAHTLALHRDLIRLRRSDPVLACVKRGTFDGAVLSADAFLLRYFSEEHGDRLLIVNLGALERFDPAPEPLLAPPAKADWRMVWSSEDPRYDGGGTAPLNWKEDNWVLPARAALFFVSETHHDAKAPRSKD